MKLTRLSNLILALSLLLVGCTSTAPDPASSFSTHLQPQQKRSTRPPALPTDLKDLAASNTAFALDFYQAVKDQDGNLFFSPYSVSLALAMLYAGASGDTAAQMAQALHFDLPPERLGPAFNALDLALESQGKNTSPEKALLLSIANSLWAQQGFVLRQAFLDSLGRNYGAGLNLVDFASAPDPARLEINRWVAEETQDLVKDLIPPGAIDASTRMVLANAIYFKARWTYPFHSGMTHEGDFHLLDGGIKKAQMMAWEHFTPLQYARGDGFQAVELPYNGGASMIILLPDNGEFSRFEQGLDAARLQAILDQMQETRVKVTMPRFKYDTSFQLAGVLQGLGMQDAFQPGKADFSAMESSRQVFLGQVIHKAFVSCDEIGTEAAAATAEVLAGAAMPSPVEVLMLIDRPFIYLIRDQSSGSVLFAGRVTTP
jgi:serpin B